ncbi:MAG: Ig-like domain-containing protein [Planctomycetota bacterium]|nr:Ig-like domain-containing protein [Planctomycetota bacterium]
MKRKNVFRYYGLVAIAGLTLGCGSSGGSSALVPGVNTPGTGPTPTVGTPVDSRSTLTVSPTSGLIADGNSRATVNVTVRDINGIALGGQAVVLAATGFSNVFAPVSGATNNSGVFTATLASTFAETKIVSATINPGAAQVILSTQPSVTFDPTPAGVPDSSQSTVTATPLTGLSSNGTDQSTVTVTVRDGGGTLLVNQQITLSSGPGVTFTPSTGSTNGGGVFTATMTSTQPGSRTVTATVNPTGINLSLAAMPVVVFDAPAGTPDPNQSTVTASRTTGVIADGVDASTITVTVRDPGGALLAGQTVQLTLTGAGNLTPLTGTTNAAGGFSAQLTSTVGGNKSVSAIVNPGASQVAISSMPTVSFISAQVADAATSTVTANPTNNIFNTGTDTSTITVTARDSSNAIIANRQVTISATGTGNTIGQATGMTNASGVFTTTLASTVAGTKTVSATVDNIGTAVTLNNMPTVDFIAVPPGPDAALSTVTANPTTNLFANGTDVSNITVTVVDAASRPLANQAVSLTATGSSNTFTNATGTTNASGVFTATLSSTDAGAKTITATINPGAAQVVLNATPTVTFAVVPLGAPDPNNSTLTANPLNGIFANGTDISTVTVTVRDGNNTILPTTAVTFSATGGGTTFANASGTTNASGIFTTTVTATVPGMKTISVAMDPAGANVTVATMPIVDFANIFNVITGTVNTDTLNGTAGRDQIDGLAGNDTLNGAGGDDLLNGGDGDDTITGGAGADQINGDAGTGDTAAYTNSPQGFNVNLAANTASGGDAQGDVLTGIENLTGSGNDDTLVGDAMDNTLNGGAGNDTLSGGAGVDILIGGPGADTLDGGANPAGMADFASYSTSAQGVSVDLQANTGTGGDAAGDTFVNIEGLIGSPQDDVLTGDGNDNMLLGGAGIDVLTGGAGDDLLDGGAGADSLNGGIGSDTVSYRMAPAGTNGEIEIDLRLGIGTDSDAEGDTYVDIENANGSDFADLIVGNALGNTMASFAGNDRIFASLFLNLGGNAVMMGGAGFDILYLTGTDVLTVDGGDDIDACILFVDTDLSNPTLNAAISNIEDFSVSVQIATPITITINAADVLGLGGRQGTLGGVPRTFIYIYGEPTVPGSIGSSVQGTGWTFLGSIGAGSPLLSRSTPAAFNAYENAALGVAIFVDDQLPQTGIVP